MRAWMKKCMALALCAALCLGLAACGENAAPSTASGANAPGFEGEETPDYNLITASRWPRAWQWASAPWR